ncbi:MAG: beta-galactosidase [Planctomycetota bacterium]
MKSRKLFMEFLVLSVGIVLSSMCSRASAKDVLSLPEIRIWSTRGAVGYNLIWRLRHFGYTDLSGQQELSRGADLIYIDRSLSADEFAGVKHCIENGSLAIVTAVPELDEQLKSILPVTIARQVTLTDSLTFISPVDPEHPVFKHIPWDSPRQFYPYAPFVVFTKSAVKGGSQVLMNFDTSDPAMVMCSLGKGKLIAFNAPTLFPNEERMAFYTRSADYIYLRLIYWARGDTDSVNRLSDLYLAQQQHHQLTVPWAKLKTRLENIIAMANMLYDGYMLEEKQSGKSAAMATGMGPADLKNKALQLWARFQKFDKMMDTNLENYTQLKSQEVLTGYKNIESFLTELQKEALALEEAIQKEIQKIHSLKSYQAKAGTPVLFGPTHIIHPGWGNPEYPQARKWHSIYELWRQKEIFGANIFDFHMDMAGFVKPGADSDNPSLADFDFGPMNCMMDVAKEMDLKVVVGTSDLGKPYFHKGIEYFQKDVPKMIGPDGKELNTPYDVRFNCFNPTMRKRRNLFLEAWAQYLDKYPNVVGFEPTNEWGVPNNHSAEAIGAFREFLQKKYNSITELNNKWNSRYSSFSDIVSPDLEKVSSESPSSSLRALWNDWCEFRRNIAVNFFKEDYLAIHKASAKRINDRCTHVAGGEYGLLTNVLQQYATQWLDSHGPHCDDPFQLDFDIGFSKKPVVMSEYYWYWWGRNGPGWDMKYRLHGNLMLGTASFQSGKYAAAEREMWRILSRGVREIRYYMSTMDFDSWDEQWAQSTVYWPDFAIKRAAYAIPTVIAEFNRVSGELEDSLPVTRIAVVEPEATRYQLDSCIKKFDKRTVVHEYQFLFDMFFKTLGHPMVFIPDTADFSKYRVLVFPSAMYLPTDVQQKIMDFVEQGGILIAIGPIGQYNEHAVKSGLLLDKLFGVKSVLTSQTGGLLKHNEVTFGKVSGSDETFAFEMSNNAANIIGRSDDGMALGAMVKYGKGHAYLYPAAASYARGTFTNFASYILQQHLQPIVSTTVPAEIYIRKAGTGEIYYVFVYHTRWEESSEGVLSWQGRCDVTDLRAQTTLKETNHLSMTLLPGEGRVYKLKRNSSN